MRRQGLLVGGSALLVAVTAVMSWNVLTSSRASSKHQAAGAGPPARPAPEAETDLAGELAAGEHEGVTPTTVSYGPFVLPPAPPGERRRRGGAGHLIGDAHLSLLLHNVPKPCQDCFLTSLRPDLVYPDGRSANLDTGVMLHHAVWFQSSRPDTTCGPETLVGRVGQRFFGTGNERTGGRFVPGFGYHVDDSSWALIVELMNHTSSPKTVNVTLEVTWRPARPAPETVSAAPGMKPLTPVWLDVGNCGDSEYSAPAGPSRRRWRWTSTLQGRVISAAGHLHDGGVKTVLTNLATGRDICTSVAGYGRDAAYRGSIESMSACNWDAIGTVREGEVLALDAYYDLSAPRDDVMGIMLAYVYETTDLIGGAPPPPQTSAEPNPGPNPSPSPSPSKHEH